MAKALKINPRDNVAVLLEEIRSGETADVATGSEAIHIQARQQIAEHVTGAIVQSIH